MSKAAMTQYLEILSDKIAEKYHLSKTDSDAYVNNSPIRELLSSDAEYVTHVPIGSWAEMIYLSNM